MTNRKIDISDDEDEFMRQLREAAIPKNCYTPIDKGNGNSAPDRVQNEKASRKGSTSGGKKSAKGDFDIDNINLNIIGLEDDEQPQCNASGTQPKVEASRHETSIRSRLAAKMDMIDKMLSESETSEKDNGDANISNPPEQSTMLTDAAIIVNTTNANTMTAVSNEITEDELTKEAAPSEKAPPVSTAKPSRVSAKMRRATRAEFCAAYTGKVDTKKGKPIAITVSNMKRLHRLCSLSGVHNACPTYIINNLLSEFLDAVEPESKHWGMLD